MATNKVIKFLIDENQLHLDEEDFQNFTDALLGMVTWVFGSKSVTMQVYDEECEAEDEQT